ncbi:adhesin biosynthesis transcription regulatory family protein [Ferrimonas balearica]|uniref:adhesin biosynthesis transcription regulatory family protein n=1 Tax=Ferrimonas balearica TaxID=44012 RepID=UPI001C974FFA|nr:adhesin biosynthesis transcription regulatory family protein [Ferrimonas balearica]MBY6104868.1 adhesin biosynthesis transcription regulatory family protein [Ferrimonas balearica]
MNQTPAGSQSKERLALLLSLTRIDSDEIQMALTDHLVRGASEIDAAEMNGVSRSNLTRALNKVRKVAATVHAIEDLDWARFKESVK